MVNYVEIDSFLLFLQREVVRVIFYYRYLFQNSFQCFIDICQVVNGFYVCGFQSSEFFICSFFFIGNDGICVVYMFVFWCSYISNVVYNWFGNVFFDVCCCFFFSVIVDFINYYDCFGLWIFFEYFENVDKVRVRDWVIVDIDIG